MFLTEDWFPMLFYQSPTPSSTVEGPCSITQQAAMFPERPVNLMPPSACLLECQTHFSFLESPFCGFPLPRTAAILK